MPNGQHTILESLIAELEEYRIDRGTTFRVSGEIGELGEDCPSLDEIADAETEVTIKKVYLVYHDDEWTVPWGRRGGRYGYLPVYTEGNALLEQNEVMATTTIQDDGTFELSWVEPFSLSRSPYLRVRVLSEDFLDPDDPTGFELLDARRVYQLSQYVGVPAVNPILVLNPQIELEFWGNETTKTLPPLDGECFEFGG